MGTSEEPLCAPGGGNAFWVGNEKRGRAWTTGRKKFEKERVTGGPASVTQRQMNQSIVFSVLPLA